MLRSLGGEKCGLVNGHGPLAMSAYPGSEKETCIPLDELTRLVSSVFRRCEMRATDAALLAGTLAFADLRGVHSHGVLRVPEYVRKLRGGGVNAAGRPRVVRDSGAALVIDGDNSMGQIGAAFAMEQAITRAKEVHVAVASVRGSNHCGAMAWFAMQALPHGMIGFIDSGCFVMTARQNWL